LHKPKLSGREQMHNAVSSAGCSELQQLRDGLIYTRLHHVEVHSVLLHQSMALH